LNFHHVLERTKVHLYNWASSSTVGVARHNRFHDEMFGDFTRTFASKKRHKEAKFDLKSAGTENAFKLEVDGHPVIEKEGLILLVARPFPGEVPTWHFKKVGDDQGISSFYTITKADGNEGWVWDSNDDAIKLKALIPSADAPADAELFAI
jgi:hypothetical protein